MKSGDILGGIASSTNTVTGVVSGLASNQGTKLTISAVNTDNTVGKDNVKLAEANNNFYANMGVNLGFNKSSSKSSSHSESAVVTTIKGKDKDSSITYNDVKNIEYVGTQAQNTKFIYNNVDNIDKRAVELNNSYSSDSKSSGVSTGVTIGYGDGVQTEANGVSISASKSKMNTNGTNFQNGRFINVDEVHNNTKNMTLSGFNQESGTVTGNIENLTIESKQNTSTTKGSTKGGSLSISANGLPSGSANYSKTNGERKYVDNASTFIIGNESNLKVGKVENTAAAIGASGNGKLSIDEYVGHNLENVDKLKTAGGSVGISTSGVNDIGINYSDKKQEGITKNTVIGNVEIGKSSGTEINKDLDTMTEMTKDRNFKTNVNIESQTIKYALNPEAFKQDLAKAKDEITDIGSVVENSINPKGKDKRNIFANLRAQRWNTSFYNVTGSRMEELSRQFKAGEIDEKELKEAARDLIKGYGKDIGIDFEVLYLDEATMPKDSKGSTGSSYILDKKNRKVLIPIDVNKLKDTGDLFGTLTEEVSHGKDALEGRQDLNVANDETNKEKGLESLGRPANEYVKNKLGEDNNSKISLTTDGIDLSNANVGEKVGDVITPQDRKDRSDYVKKEYFTPERQDKIADGFEDIFTGGFTIIAGTIAEGLTYYYTGGIGYFLVKGTTTSAYVVGGNRALAGLAKVGNGIYGSEVREDTLNPIRDMISPKYQHYYDGYEFATMFAVGEAATFANKLNQESQISNKETAKLEQRQGQNPQQGQRGQNSVVQNNKNSINKTQTQGNQDYPNNQQVSKGSTSNNQQGAPVSKTPDTNKIGVSQAVADDIISKLKPINLSKLEVVKNSTPKEANLFWKEKAGYTNNPYDESYEVKLVKNNGESFVRVYTVSKTNKASAWFMREDDIIGLTPEEIKDKFALPYTPTHVVDVKIGNIIIRTGVVKEVDGWGKGKGQQFDTNGTRLNEGQFINEREIGERYERK